MSCPDFVYTPAGRQGIGVVQPQSGLDYPLVKPSEDIRYLLADFYLAYDDPGEYGPPRISFKLPLRIKYLLNVGCEQNEIPAGAPTLVHDADIVIVDSDGRQVLNTATTAATCGVRDWGADYKIYEWLTEDAVCRLVAHKTWKTGEPEPRQYAQYLEPTNAVLDERAVEKMPRRLRSISVKQLTGTVTNGPYTGKIRFKNSYNTEIVPAETTITDFVVNTRIDFSAVAGTGIGYFPVCGSGYDENTNEPIPQPIKTINNIPANTAGDFLLASDDCMFIRRPTVLSGGGLQPSKTAHQQIGSDCGPCCVCPDYVNTALYLNQVAAQYQLIGQRAATVKKIHEDNIAKWVDKRACTVNNPLKLILVPQCCPLLDVVLMLCNPCQKCYLPSTLSLTLDAPNQNVNFEVFCGNTTLYGPDGVSTNVIIKMATLPAGTRFDVQMPAVKDGGSAYVKFRVKAATAGNYPIRASLSGVFSDNTPILTGCPEEVIPGGRQVAMVEKFTTLNCEAGGTDNRPCAIT